MHEGDIISDIALADNNGLDDNDVRAFRLLYGVDIEDGRRLKSKNISPPAIISPFFF